jgi:glycogen synthase
MYTHHTDHWSKLVQNCMQQDWSWGRSAAQYEKLYEMLKQ